MAWSIDARIPVLFATEPAEGDVVLRPDTMPRHPVGCTCCVPRSADAAALDRLFLDRVRGAIPWFTRVVVATEAPGLREALQNDPVLVARFRLG